VITLAGPGEDGGVGRFCIGFGLAGSGVAPGSGAGLGREAGKEAGPVAGGDKVRQDFVATCSLVTPLEEASLFSSKTNLPLFSLPASSGAMGEASRGGEGKVTASLSPEGSC
jgi:hypothetical protein